MTDTSGLLKGIDVSHYQGVIDWAAVAADGIRFCFLKATEGTSDIDPRFHANWTGAAAAGILRGAYHFFRPGQDAGRQAEHFLSVAPVGRGALPPALDVEVTDGVDPAAIQAGIRTWVQAVEAAAGCSPILYADAPFWQEHVKADFSRCPLWLACYAERAQVPPPWQDWTFWQHSDKGSVRGVPGPVDLDYCALPEQRLRELGTKSPTALDDTGQQSAPKDSTTATDDTSHGPARNKLEQKIESDIEKTRKLF